MGRKALPLHSRSVPSQPFQPEPVDRLLKIDFVTLDPPHDSDKNCDRLKGFVLESHTLDIKDTPKQQ